MTSARYRVMHKFWLDVAKDDEDTLDATIHELKRKRTFTKTIRDGLRLICDLHQGRLDVLFELFPWVRAEFLSGMQPQETAGERALREQLERIERQLIGRGSVQSSVQERALVPVTEQIDAAPSVFVDSGIPEVSAQQARQTFSASIGNLFADDDDLFDDE